MKTSSKDRQNFLNMQQHPEDFSDEQLEGMMADIDQEPDVDAEWAKFEATHFAETKRAGRHLWMRKAASIVVGILFVGMVYAAAVMVGVAPNIFAPKAVETQAVAESASVGATVGTKSEQQKADDVLFDNATLEEIMSEFATYYNIKVRFDNDRAKSVRLYFNWDKSVSLDANIAQLNAFEPINVRKEADTLIVE